MLVQVYFTEAQSLPANFDEAQHRVTQHMQYYDWKEFIVAWRKDRLELYTDHVCSPTSARVHDADGYRSSVHPVQGVDRGAQTFDLCHPVVAEHQTFAVLVHGCDVLPDLPPFRHQH